MPQRTYDSIVKSHSNVGTIEYFVHASDTSNGRSAGYAGYVLLESGVYYARTAYGSLGKNYRGNSLGAFTSLDIAKKEVMKVFNGKLKKNYKDDTYIVNQHATNQPKPQPQQSSNNPYGFAENIAVFSHYAPAQVELDPYTTPIIFDEKIAFEWYPNRMRFMIYGFYNDAIGVYNLSGRLTDTIQYPIGYDNTVKEFQEIASNGLLFVGYTDPNDNIVLLRYIAEVHNQRGTEVSGYSKQRNILLMALYTLTDHSGISITSNDNPIYVNPKIVLTTDKEHAIKHRVALNRYANNLIVFEPNDNMAVLNCIER